MANVTYTSNLVPDSNLKRELGSSTKRWKINGVDDPEFLPKVNDSDEGKFLVVTNGAWAPVSVPMASEEAF